MTAIQITTTVDDSSKAQDIAQELIQRNLAACVQIVGPVTSVYRWQGKVETAQEWQCVIKTLSRVYDQIETTILDIHPYDEPEIIALSITHVSAGYLKWMEEQVA